MNKENNCFPIIVSQFVLTISTVIVYSSVCIIAPNGVYSFVMLFSQVFLALSSNVCSISCTLSYLSTNDEGSFFQAKRSILLVISLVIFIVLSLSISLQVLQDYKSQLCMLGFVFVLLIPTTYFLIIELVNVENKNSQAKTKLNSMQNKLVVDAKKTDESKVGEELFNIKGAK